MVCTVWNCPVFVPLDPQDFMYFPSLSNFATLELSYPSATKIFPAASQATSVGLRKLSPGAPAPVLAGGPPPPGPPGPPPPGPPRAGAGAGGVPGAGPEGIVIASGFLPIVMTTWPWGLTLITMLEPS